MSSNNFKLSRVSGQPVSDAELLADLKRVSEIRNAQTVSMPKYDELGKYSNTTLARRFGTWNNALIRAGLTVSNEVNITDERLFENILALWQHYGRQPRRSELAITPSTISQHPYNRKFSSWTAALEAFVQYANTSGADAPIVASDGDNQPKTGRDPSLRLRWHILQRDRFTCCACGASPALTVGVELHVDHVIPWSKGGETILSNLQTLCSVCNIGKSNVYRG